MAKIRRHTAEVSTSRRAGSQGERKLGAPVTLFAAIEAEQHEALRAIAFGEHRSLADVVREALSDFLSRRNAPQRLTAGRR